MSTTEARASVEARDFTYCSATYHDPLRFEKFIVLTGLVSEARPIAEAYALERWGEPSKLHLYPRTYVVQARALLAEGRVAPLAPGRISDHDLAELCDRNGFPSVGDKLVGGQTQEEATAYMVGLPVDANGFYDDGEGRWLQTYVASLQVGRL